MSEPLVYAHRGAAIETPENTLVAFARALEVGADALEMDAHMTRDGVPVVSHDPDGRRMCNEPTKIRDVTRHDLKSWDAGYGYIDEHGERPFRGKGLQIPTVEMVLREFPDTPLNIDLKQRSPSMVEAMLRLVRAHRAQERVTLASFSMRTLLHVRARGYEGATSLGPWDLVVSLFGPRWLVRYAPLQGTAAQIPPRHGKRVLATPENIAKLHALGMRVDFWTINDAEEARALTAMGADGIMTDDPANIAPAVHGRR